MSVSYQPSEGELALASILARRVEDSAAFQTAIGAASSPEEVKRAVEAALTPTMLREHWHAVLDCFLRQTAPRWLAKAPKTPRQRRAAERKMADLYHRAADVVFDHLLDRIGCLLTIAASLVRGSDQDFLIDEVQDLVDRMLGMPSTRKRETMQ
ncbi:hypothetical protein [Belnapia moabensis]|uniref:hypothetical protein n=1 Tax=Belnapia moabensis TaxID=365533 RepID=UPI0005BCDB73|nr:hypothetical protein [Belnapia moabensis]